MPPWETERQADRDADEGDEDLPSFLNEASTDQEALDVLTDGGDDEGE